VTLATFSINQINCSTLLDKWPCSARSLPSGRKACQQMWHFLPPLKWVPHIRANAALHTKTTRSKNIITASTSTRPWATYASALL